MPLDFIAVDAEVDRLIDGIDAMSEREMEEADVQIRILRNRQKALQGVMMTTPATPEGLRAKAAETRAWITPNQPGTAPYYEAARLAWSLCSDLLEQTSASHRADRCLFATGTTNSCTCWSFRIALNRLFT